MTPTLTETIYAVATPPGRGALAVLRVSGPQSHQSLKTLIGDQKFPPVRAAALRHLGYEGKEIDHALVTVFAAPNSFTGENTVEYHIHGGISVIQSLLQYFSKQQNHRMALPGEFTRRAFENEKLDLTEAEAIADVIDAETEAQRLQALSQLSGSLEAIYEGWKSRLAHILALMEADLDFSDQDLPDDMLLKVRPDISDLLQQIGEHLNDNRRGERLRNGFHVAIMGAPNAGKSSLLNALARREAAIVSPTAGTTRDVIEVHLDLGGLPVIVADTAGLRSDEALVDDHGAIESEGIRRALARGQDADLKLLIFDATIEPDAHTLSLVDDRSIIVFNKSDLSKPSGEGIGVSTFTGEGLDILLHTIVQKLNTAMGMRNTPALTRARHREALQLTFDALHRSADAPLPELAAEDLRLAIRHLGSITGRVDVEDLLDMIFRDFCIGK